jgi:hypothetical protein
MRTVFCVFFFCVAGFARGEIESASGKPVEVRAAISEKLKREFKYEPQAAVDQPPAETEAIVLPRFKVIDSKLRVDQAIHDEREKVENERFSWKRGGTILKLGPLKVMFKYDPETNLLYLLRFQ